jgi:hypothetical protein
MQEVPTRLHTASSQLNDLYQDLDSFIDELADAAPFESKVMDGTMWPSELAESSPCSSFHIFFSFLQNRCKELFMLKESTRYL